MRLSVQLVLLVLLLILLLFAGTFWIGVQNGRTYLEGQLASHAQDGATSLGLSLTSHLASGDQATVTAMTDALFDGGDYLQVIVERLDGEAWIERRSPLRAPGVPGWFIDRIALEAPERYADVMHGWRQAGRVVVRSHPGYAYEQLWANARQSLQWYAVSAIAVLFAGVLLLRWLLRPLRQLEVQAVAICDRQFPDPLRVPFAFELRPVVRAMNRLTEKVQRMLGDAESLAARLRQQANVDPVTGLVNRRHFMALLDDRLRDPAGLAGGLMLIQLRNFKEHNQRFGYPAGDRLLRATGELLSEQLQDLDNSTLAHLAGADFAVFTEGQDSLQFDATAQRLAQSLAALATRVELHSADAGHLGGVYYTGQSRQVLLASADTALRAAQSKGPNQFELASGSGSAAPIRAVTEWRTLIQRALQDEALALARQPVFDRERNVLHQEVFLRMGSPDEPARMLAAGSFFPMAERAGLSAELDRYVIDKVLRSPIAAEGSVAVNLASSSLTNDGLLDWLATRLSANSATADAASRLILEVSEYGATANTDQLRLWIAQLRPLGVRFALDHFGRGFSSLTYLRSLRVDFVKLDGSFARDLDSNQDHQFFVRVLRGLAQSLDIQLIAESIETEAVWQTLLALQIDGGQGYWLAEPTIGAASYAEIRV